MVMAIIQRIFAVIVFTTLICGGSCINCFYCNSMNNSACLDFSLYDGETLARVVPVIDCQLAGLPQQYNFFCRKLVQIIRHSDRDDEIRITRGCGWIEDEKHRPCYRADTSDHLETACQCFSNHCNSADSADPASSVLLFIVFSAVLYFYR